MKIAGEDLIAFVVDQSNNSNPVVNDGNASVRVSAIHTNVHLINFRLVNPASVPSFPVNCPNDDEVHWPHWQTQSTRERAF